MKACGGAHYWAREVEQYGYQVRRINPRFVKPFVKSNKNDARKGKSEEEIFYLFSKAEIPPLLGINLIDPCISALDKQPHHPADV